MNKNFIWLLLIIIIVVIIVGAYFLYGIIPNNILQTDNVEPGVEVQTESTPGIPQPEPLPTSPRESAVFEVHVNNLVFTPVGLTIRVGDTVKWINDDQQQHQISNAYFTSSVLNPGDTFSQTFIGSATYNYRCKIHPSMIGQIIVTP